MSMNYVFLDAFGCASAAVAFAVFLIPPGYLFAYMTQIADFRRISALQQLLWSVALSIPLALVISAVLGRHLSPAHTLFLFELIAVLALTHLVLRARRVRPTRIQPDSALKIILFSMLALSVYLALATSSIQIGQRLFESVNASDWSVRIPLVGAALRNGVPPGNPLFAYEGHAQTSRYYFYWYALCAQVGRLTGLPARACLSGSVIWSGFGLVSILFLYLKHLAGITTTLRRQCALALGLCCVMGIDIIPAVAGLFQHPLRLAPEIEWWRGDRLPSFLGAVIFAPHHIGGIVCAATGFLVLALTTLRLQRPPSRLSWRPYPLAALAGGLCFAATAGASTYIAFCFAFICIVYGLDLLKHRRWLAVGALVLSGALAVVLSRAFLHEMLSGPAPASADPGGAHFFKFVVRDFPDAQRIVGFLSRRLHHEINSGPLSYLFATPIFPILLASEAGFFIFPLAIRIRRDLNRLRSHVPFSAGERALWACFIGAAIPALFISSEPTQHVNDLGRHAGLILRLILIVWSTPIVYEFLERRRASPALAWRHPLLTRIAVAMFVLGIATQLWQIVLDRTFLMLMQTHAINPEQPFQADADPGGRYFDLRRGLETVQRNLPESAVIAGNPGSRYLSIAEFYAARQFAAGDSGCVATFGGNPELCKAVVSELQRLYGGIADTRSGPFAPFHTNAAPDAEATTSVGTFRRTCSDQRLSALIAMDSDPAWKFPTSWVWQQPLYATSRVRILPCPSLQASPS